MGEIVEAVLVLDDDGNPLAGVPFVLWTDPIAGSIITGCTAPDGVTPLDQTTTPAGQTPPFRYPGDRIGGFIAAGASFRQSAISSLSVIANLNTAIVGGSGNITIDDDGWIVVSY